MLYCAVSVLCRAAACCAVPCCAEPVLCSRNIFKSGGVVQGNVLPAGLDLGSISALAAALGVQSMAMPGFTLSPFLPLTLPQCHHPAV